MDKVRTIVSGNRVHRPVLDETLTNEDWKVAREELNETPERRETALKVLKAKLVAQNDFTPRTDDNYLLRFLRCRKFDCDKAFQTIQEYYQFRKLNPDLYPTPSKVEKVLRAGIFNILPHRDHKGRVIFIIKLKRWNPTEISFIDFLATGVLAADYILDNPVTQIHGYVGIWDFDGMTFRQTMQFCVPKHITLLCAIMQDRFPGRFKVAHCINCSSYMHTAWNLIRTVLKEKFKKRVQIYGSNYKALNQYIDSSVLPSDFRGPHPKLEHAEIVQRILEKEPNFIYNQKFGY